MNKTLPNKPQMIAGVDKDLIERLFAVYGLDGALDRIFGRHAPTNADILAWKRLGEAK